MENNDTGNNFDMKPQLDLAVGQANEAVKTIEAILKKASDYEMKIAELLSKAGESQAKADNEALRAFQAKNLIEDHSNAVSKLKGTIEADSSAIAAKKAEIETLAQGLANLRGRSEADTTTIADVRSKSEVAGKAIAEASGKAAAVQSSIDEIKKNVDAVSQRVREASKNVDTDLSTVSTAKSSAENLLSNIQKSAATTNELSEKAKTGKESIESLEKSSRAKVDSLDALIQRTTESNEKVNGYEAELKRLVDEFSSTKTKVESLLPGATSAGLASSFCAQKNRFKTPQRIWGITFALSIGLLIVVAAVGGSKYLVGSSQDWDLIWHQLIERLPFVIPLVWLGVYAGRQYMLSLRMEEEYAFKEALSTAFEGYRREMASIHQSGPEDPINKLCAYVLASLARRPGLIYEGKHEDITPFTPAIDAAQRLIPTAVDAVAANIKKSVPVRLNGD